MTNAEIKLSYINRQPKWTHIFPQSKAFPLSDRITKLPQQPSCGLFVRETLDRFPAQTKFLSLIHSDLIGSGVHLSSYSADTGCSFSEDRVTATWRWPTSRINGSIPPLSHARSWYTHGKFTFTFFTFSVTRYYKTDYIRSAYKRIMSQAWVKWEMHTKILA